LPDPAAPLLPDVFLTDHGGTIRSAGSGPSELLDTQVADLTCLSDAARATLLALIQEATSERLLEATITFEEPFTSRGPMVALAIRVPGERDGRVLVTLTRPREVPDSQRLRELDQLARAGSVAQGVAHDLNSTLIALDLGVQALGRTMLEGCARTWLLELGEMMQCAAHLVQSIRAVAPAVPAAPVNMTELAALVHETRRALALLAGPRVRLAVQSRSWPIRVRCSRPALEQVLMKLVSNASEAANGNGRIVVTAAQTSWPGGRVHSGGHLRPGNYGVLEVSDQGPGLLPEQLSRLFEPSCTFGLTLVARTAVETGGGVVVDAPPGAGKTFRVLLPLDPTASVK